MRNSKLLRLIELLEPLELKEFNRFLRSPYFNTNVAVEQLFQNIIKTDPHHKKFTEEHIYKKIYPNNKKYNHNTIRMLKSTLVKLIEKFMVTQAIFKDESRISEILTESYAKRDKLLTGLNKIDNRIKELEKVPDYKKGERYYLEFIKLYQQKCDSHQLTYEDKIMIDELRTNYIDEYCLQTKLKIWLETAMFGTYKSKSLKLDILKLISKLNYEAGRKDNLTSLYVSIFKLFISHNKEGEAEIYQANFSDKFSYLNQEDKNCLVRYFQHFCMEQIEKGNYRYRDFLVHIVKNDFIDHIIEAKGYISTQLFINVVQLGSLNYDFDFVSIFIDKYTHKLLQEEKHEVINYSQALINFKKRNFSAALRFLATAQFNGNNSRWRIQGSILELKILYELSNNDNSYLELLDSKIHSFTMYLRRNRSIPQEKKKGILSFIRCLKKIILLKNKSNLVIRLKELREEIDNSELSYSKNWFIEKLDNIKHTSTNL